MPLEKRMLADLLFLVQIICAVAFGGSQFFTMLNTSQGVSISWFATWEVFLVLNLFLTIRAHRNKPSRVTLQTVWSYAITVVVVTLDLSAIVWRNTGAWSGIDTLTVVCVGIGVVATCFVAKFKQLPIADPLVRGYLAIFFKAIPQLTLAYNMLQVGGAGLAGVAIVVGHLAILTRLGQLWFSIREAGWDRNRIGSAISELANEVSWVVVTIVWLSLA